MRLTQSTLDTQRSKPYTSKKHPGGMSGYKKWEWLLSAEMKHPCMLASSWLEAIFAKDAEDNNARRHYNENHFMVNMAHPEGEHFDVVWHVHMVPDGPSKTGSADQNQEELMSEMRRMHRKQGKLG